MLTGTLPLAAAEQRNLERTTKIGGIGMGLSICQTIINNHEANCG